MKPLVRQTDPPRETCRTATGLPVVSLRSDYCGTAGTLAEQPNRYKKKLINPVSFMHNLQKGSLLLLRKENKKNPISYTNRNN